MPIVLTRIEPKLNSMYRITKADSESSIRCRINFNIIDLMYTHIAKQQDCNKTTYYHKLYEFLDIGETYFENLRNGKRVERIECDRTFGHIKTNELINGKILLEISGVSTKQWKRYFWICEKYARLKKDKADVKYINEAKRCKTAFLKMILTKITNMEMNASTCRIYKEMSEFLFADELAKQYRKEGEKWLAALRGMTKSSLEGLKKVDKQKYGEVYRTIYNIFKDMKEIKEQKDNISNR